MAFVLTVLAADEPNVLVRLANPTSGWIYAGAETRAGTAISSGECWIAPGGQRALAIRAASTQGAVTVMIGWEPRPLGDLNGDGAVDGADREELARQFGGAGSGDFNGDGVVDVSDLLILGTDYGDDY